MTDAVMSSHHVPGLSLTPEQVLARRSRLGASEMGAVLGLSKYKSPIALWAEKRGMIPPSFEGNEFTEWGTRLEGVVCEAYAQKRSDVEGAKLAVEACSTFIIPAGWRSATPDRKVFRVDDMAGGFAPWLRGLEAKCRGDYSATDFGEPGTDEVPDEVAIQCHTNMSVLRALETPIIVNEWDVATLIGGNRFRSYRVYYDAQIDADITEAAHTFWHKYVIGGVEPPVDASEATSEYLKERFKQATEVMIEATPEQDELLAALRETRRAKTEIEAHENGLKNKLMAVIGENAGIQGRSGKVTWKAPSGATVKWKEVAEALNAPADLIAQYSTPMSRRFLPTFPKR